MCLDSDFSIAVSIAAMISAEGASRVSPSVRLLLALVLR